MLDEGQVLDKGIINLRMRSSLENVTCAFTSLHPKHSLRSTTTMRLLASLTLPFLLSRFVTAQYDFLKQMDSQITLGGQNIDRSGTPDSEGQKPLLSDILTIQNSASIFYSYARETDTGKLLSKDGARITVFAPTNKAVMALARKP